MIGRIKCHVHQAAVSIVRLSVARNLLMHAAARCGTSLVLCYHRVAPPAAGDEAVEPVPPACFAEQMRALKAAGDIVSLGDLLALSRPGARPVFAVTFDDDDASHVRYALPILRALDIPATFFLSGRALHGLGAYWWTQIERSVAAIGIDATARLVGHPGNTLKAIVRGCRSAGGTLALPQCGESIMTTADIRALADAGMGIGFHTVHHPALPSLDSAGLDRALTEGRAALAAAAGVPVPYLAYPFGRADARVADRACRAGYRAAFVTAERPVTCRSDPFLLPRWQPGAAARDAFLAQVTVRLAVALTRLPGAWSRTPRGGDGS